MREITLKKPSSGKGVEKLVNFQELLRLSTIQLNDAGYRDLLANELHRIMLESANALRQNIAYAEFIIPVEIKIKVIILLKIFFLNKIFRISLKTLRILNISVCLNLYIRRS